MKTNKEIDANKAQQCEFKDLMLTPSGVCCEVCGQQISEKWLSPQDITKLYSKGIKEK